jgi:hypothetical protein
MKNEQSIWELTNAEVRKPGTVHFVIFTVLVIVGTVIGSFGRIPITLGSGIDEWIKGYWIPVTIQVVGSLWFGLWGVLAGGLFPIISWMLNGTLPYVSLIYFPANVVQGLLPLAAFKYLNHDPRLRTSKDLVVYILSGAILNNILGSLVAVAALEVANVPHDMVGGGISLQHSHFITAWTVGNAVPALVFGIILLKVLSPIVVKHRSFCKGWWA